LSRPRYLTPDAPASGFICRRLLIPNGVDWLALVNGALTELNKVYNFEEFGDQTPDDTVALFRIMTDDFALPGERTCRVIGEIIAYAGDTSPDANWLPCDGASLLRADYPDLFAVVGTAYGSVDGTHFSLPDIAGRSPVGSGSGAGLTPRAIGDSFGEENHTLSVAETPSHTHTDTGHTHIEGVATAFASLTGTPPPVPSAIPGVGVTGSGTASLTATGGDGGHNNLAPSLAITFLIVAK